MKRYIFLIVLFIPYLIFAQSSEKKWLDNVRLDVGINYGVLRIDYIASSAQGTKFHEVDVDKFIGFDLKLSYRNNYFLSGLESYSIYINNIQIGTNILYFIPEAQSKGQYFGPNLKLGIIFQEQYYPSIGFGLDMYYNNIYLGFSRHYLLGETSYMGYESKESFLFVTLGYSFNRNTFKRKTDK